MLRRIKEIEDLIITHDDRDMTIGAVCTVITALKRLEAAIGIEPMNKGFAELKPLFAQVSVDAATCGFVVTQE